jgi:hypothetical protein
VSRVIRRWKKEGGSAVVGHLKLRARPRRMGWVGCRSVSAMSWALLYDVRECSAASLRPEPRWEEFREGS